MATGKPKYVGLIVVAAIIAAFVIEQRTYKAADTPTVSAKVAPTSPDTAVPEWQRRALAERKVREMLRDPSSAEFSDIRLSRRSGAPVVCGTVNSNNGFGGKTGPQRFISGGVTALEEQMGQGEMDKAWQQICG